LKTHKVEYNNLQKEEIMKLSLQAQPILLPSPVLIIGTYDSDGRPNIMNAAWGGIASSQPPCISVSLREATLSYHNIRKHQAFTVNIPSEKFFREADYAGLVSGKEHEKFNETHLTAEKSKHVNAPIVKEFPYALECKLVKEVSLGSHTMFIGEIVGITADSDIVSKDQFPDIEKVRPILFGSFGSRAYYSIGEKLGDAFSSGKELMQN
jgi:flavin reductase (DIM6/NTAB) family NADH-FMN oxidoreductase RutF